MGGTQLALAQPDLAPEATGTPKETPAPIETAREAEPSATRVLIVPIASDSNEMLAAATRITDALAAAASESGAAVETSQASRAQITDLTDCRNEIPACMQTMLDAVSADLIILGNMVSTEGGWILTVKQIRRAEEDKIATHVLPRDQPELLDAKVRKLSAETFGNTVEADDPAVSEPILEKPPIVEQPKSGFSLRKVNTAAWAVTGAGVGMATVGATLLVIASGKQGDVDDAPDATLEDINKLRDLEDTAKSYELFGNSFLIVGAVTSMVGITWAVLQARSSTEAAPTALFLTPSPTPGGAMVTLTFFP